jgi:hypothetical protein
LTLAASGQRSLHQSRAGTGSAEGVVHALRRDSVAPTRHEQEAE